MGSIKEIKVGDVKRSSGVSSTVTDIDPTTGAISWDIDYVPNLDKLLDNSDELTDTAKGVYTKSKGDKKFLDIYESSRRLRNIIRTHIRNNYPEEYKKSRRVNEEIDLSKHMQLGDDWGEIIFYLEKYGTDEEIDAYITAFKEQTGPHFDDSDWDHVGEFQKWVKTAMRADEMSTSGGAGSYLTPYAFRLKGQKPNDKAYKELGYKEVEEGIGATLGPGPSASEDGVKNNVYVKQFKYKLVPKKIKGSGIEVKQLFEAESPQEFQNKRIAAFDTIEQELNDIYKMLSNAKNQTSDYYNDNTTSYQVLTPTDLILDYIKDIKDLLKGE